jgi:hypothetical protein
MNPQTGQFDEVKKKKQPLFDRVLNAVDHAVGNVGKKAVKGYVKLGHALGDHHPANGGTFDPDCSGCQSDMHEALSKRGPGIVGYIDGGKK